MVFSHEEFALASTMEIEQQNQPIREVSTTSPNTHQSPRPRPSLPINEKQEQPIILLPAAPSNNATPSDDHEANEFIDEEEYIDQAFFESFPPGYRFCPTDSELIVYYLRKKIAKDELPRNQIRHINLYQHSPDKISERYPPIGEKEWYFFTPRNRKYRNGSRPNRAAGSGYWKATGADKLVNNNGSLVGYRKALVFYEGKPPKGVKTNWIMHEYRVNDPPRKKTSAADMRLDDFVLCRIYKKIDKSLKSRPRNEDVEDLENGYPIPQGNEIFDQNIVYPSNMDMGGIDREFNGIEAESGYVQSHLHSGFPDINSLMDNTSHANSVNCFNFQQPLSYGAKPVCCKGPLMHKNAIVPTENANAIVPKDLKEGPICCKGPPMYPTENAIVPKDLKEGPLCMTKDFDAFNLHSEFLAEELAVFDHLYSNPPSNNSFFTGDIPPMPKGHSTSTKIS